MMIYATWLVGCYLFIQHELATFVMRVPGPGIFIVSVGVAAFFLLMYCAIAAVMRRESANIGAPTNAPIPATIALVGPSYAGKTVFLSRAYSLLRSVRGGFINLEPTPESNAYINRILDDLDKNRTWPPGSVQASDLPFSLKYGMNEMVRFMWLDLPGKVFTDPDDPAYTLQVARFKQHLVNADAVAMIIDGEQLAQAVEGGGELLNQHIYKEVAEVLHKRLKEVGEGARSVPLAVIITKSCLASEASQRKFRAYVQDIINGWFLLAEQSGLGKRPAVKVFLSSAVVTKRGQPNNPPLAPTPLMSEQCMEPVMWLASQIMRANMSLLDHAAGFHGRADLPEYILQLESLSSR